MYVYCYNNANILSANAAGKIRQCAKKGKNRHCNYNSHTLLHIIPGVAQTIDKNSSISRDIITVRLHLSVPESVGLLYRYFKKQFFNRNFDTMITTTLSFDHKFRLVLVFYYY